MRGRTAFWLIVVAGFAIWATLVAVGVVPRIGGKVSSATTTTGVPLYKRCQQLDRKMNATARAYLEDLCADIASESR